VADPAQKDETLMRRTWMVIWLIALLAITPGVASAVQVQMDFEGLFGDAIDGTDLFSYSGAEGLDTFQLVVTATGGDFNKTSSGFGINAPGSGDDTDAFDNGLTNEAMRIAFNTTADIGVKVVSLEFDRLTGSGGTGEDQALLSFYSGPGDFDNSLLVTNANTAGDDKANFNGVDFAEQVFNPGAYLDISVHDGNGFGIEMLIVEVSGSYYTPSGGGAVPEPSTAILLLLGTSALFGIRRRRAA